MQDDNPPIDLQQNLIDLATYRHADRVAGDKPDPIVIHVAYAYDTYIYRAGQIVAADATEYKETQFSHPNDMVNKFGRAYEANTKLWLHKRLADVIIDSAIDMRDRHQQFTVVMDGLRTFNSGRLMEQNRPDLVEARLLAPAGTSAHNRALAVDSKLFMPIDPSAVLPSTVPLSMLKEADELGHLDDLNMKTSNRFYPIASHEDAYKNRLHRLQAWQRASVKNKLPVANLIAEFWDDRVPGGPADMWRVLTCRAMCIGVDGNPATNMVLQALKTNLGTLSAQYEEGITSRDTFAQNAYIITTIAWDQLFTQENKLQLKYTLGEGAETCPALEDFIFHEWLATIHDRDLKEASFPAQSAKPTLQSANTVSYNVAPGGRTLH